METLTYNEISVNETTFSDFNSMIKRASYHTTLKELTHFGLLPPKYEKTIPRTNIHRWKHDDNINRFVGSEINQIADKHTELIKTLNEYPKMFYAYGRLIKTVIRIVEKAQDYRKLVKSSKEEVVQAINRVREYVPIDKAVKLFSITRSTFYTWTSDVTNKCKNSYFNRCNKLYSGQIIPSEIQKAKEYLTNPAISHWSIKSIYHYGIRKGDLSISLNTFYMINNKLNLKETYGGKKRFKKRKKGIRASTPNQIWHADITIFKTLDGVKHYIYFVIDNYSRVILSYEILDRVSGLIRLSTLEDAYNKAKSVSNHLNVKLIVDGGAENNNLYIDEFINREGIHIEKLIALKDIDYSNSMIEATNKTIKYRYLFPVHPHNIDELREILNYGVKDFNETCPNGQLKGLTPYEAWMGKTVKSINQQRTILLKEAKKNRLAYNRVHTCELCNH
ncbi:MAG: transposase [Flavobacteriales bacterium]|nr:transposase [Flavobacteriales bacterium]